MKFNNTIIQHFSAHLPDQYISSSEIEDRLGNLYQRLRLPTGRLELMTGIQTRGFWESGTRPSDLASTAGEKLFEETNFPREEVDLLIHASVCRDFLEPSTASVVHHNLKLPSHSMIFDLSNACLGVVNAISVAGSMIESGQIQSALIVSGENGGPLLEETIQFLNNDESINRKNIKKYIANLTIGSGACALLVTHKDLAKKSYAKVLGGSVRTDSSANVLCQGDGNPNQLMMETDSEALLKAGVALATKTWQDCKTILELNNKDFNWALGHQVGVAHEKLTMETLKMDKTPTTRTYPVLGNTGSAALPLTFEKLAYQEKQLKDKDKIAFLGIGSGLTSVMLGLEWTC